MKPRLRNLLPRLDGLARRSIIAHQHAAAVLVGGAPVAWGFNSLNGHKPHHAEYAAIRRYLMDLGFMGWIQQQCILSGWERRSRFKRA